jgi:hypothetical protein
MVVLTTEIAMAACLAEGMTTYKETWSWDKPF